MSNAFLWSTMWKYQTLEEKNNMKVEVNVFEVNDRFSHVTIPFCLSGWVVVHCKTYRTFLQVVKETTFYENVAE